jgi:hypothetical protein
MLGLEDDSMIDPETEHLMVRAKEEAVLAIQARHPAAARAHQGMAVRYSAKAVIGLVEEERDPVESESLPQSARPEP